MRISLMVAVLMVASPHLSLPLRRFGRWLVFLAALSVCFLGVSTPTGAAAGLFVAAIAASLVHLALGSSAGRPGLNEVSSALAELGVQTTSLHIAARQPAGVFLVDAEDAAGPLTVKVYGRDAHDTQLLSTLWRTLWFRSEEPSFTFSRIQHVEHEAFLTLLARQAGVPTDTVVIAGATSRGDALLVLRPEGDALDGQSGSPAGATLAASLWQSLDRLHRAGISHGQVAAPYLRVHDGVVGFVDFRGAVVAAEPERLRRDHAQALVTNVLLFGTDVALQSAVDHLGREALAQVVPYLQDAALAAHHRAAARAGELDIDQLRETVAEQCGVEKPELQQLRRVTWGSVFQTAMLLVAFTAVAVAFTKLDLELMADALRDASWWLVAVAFVAAQLPRVTQSMSTLGASPIPLPLGPVYSLQLAVSYVNLAIPTTAARVAVNIRFFQRHGLPPGSAVSIGALDGFSGFIVQVGLLGGILLFSSASLDLDLDLSLSGDRSGLLLAIGAVVVIAVVVVAATASWRRAIVTWSRTLAREAAGTFRGLASPKRLGLLLGGNLATEVLFAMTLGLFAQALGFPIGLGELLLINLSVALLAGLMPVPGGIGVAEGGLTFGLISAGMPEEAALAAVILYRVATFYLPPVWGFFAFRWLERNGHL
jgi:glycosyltransferase 2 family protein